MEDALVDASVAPPIVDSKSTDFGMIDIDFGDLRIENIDVNVEAPCISKWITPQSEKEAKIEIYDINYRRIEISDWQQEPPFLSEHSNLWNSRDDFRPGKFSDNVTRRQLVWRSKCYMIAFLLNFAQTLIAFLYCSAKMNDKSFGQIVIASFFVPSIALIFHFIVGAVSPKMDLKMGAYVSILLTFAVCVLVLILKFFFAIAFTAGDIAIGAISIFISQANVKYSGKIYKHVNSRFIVHCLNLSVLVCVVLLIIGLCALQFYIIGYLAIYSDSMALFRVSVICVYVLLLVWSILTLGNVVYMTMADTAVRMYFLEGTPYEPKRPILESFKHAMSVNFGVACKTALFIPFFEPARTVSFFDENSVPRLLAKFIGVVKIGAIEFCKRIDQAFRFPARYGMIYSNVFNIDLEEGNRRYFENCSKYYVHLLSDECIIGNVLSFKCFNAGIYCGMLGYGLSVVREFESVWLCAMFGFIAGIALLHVLRSAIRGAYEGTFVAFAEEPARMETMSSELYQVIESKYNEVLTRRRNVLNRHFE